MVREYGPFRVRFKESVGRAEHILEVAGNLEKHWLASKYLREFFLHWSELMLSDVPFIRAVHFQARGIHDDVSRSNNWTDR